MLASPIDKSDVAPYRDMKRIFEKSVVTARTIDAGKALSRDDLAFKKPGDGIAVARWSELIGRRAVRDLPADHKLADTDLE
jgi:sialic acid synthase SpsE